MDIRARSITRRVAGVGAALAVVTGVLFNLPAHADNEACPGLQQIYISNPAVQQSLLPTLTALGCSIPGATTTTVAPTTTTSTTTAPTTTTTVAPNAGSPCPALQQSYLTATAAQPLLLSLLLANGCTVPTLPTTTTTVAPTTTTTIPPTTTTIPPTTTTTINPSVTTCAALQQAYLATPAASKPAFAQALIAAGCTVPINAGE